MRRIVFPVALVALLAGCAQLPGDSNDPNGPAVSGLNDDPSSVELVNLWRVAGAEGESAETWLRLDYPEFQLWRDCGMLSGSWKVSGELFVATVHGGIGDCVANNELPNVEWLESSTAFRPVNGGWELTDASGSVTASLSVNGAPEPIDSVAEFYTEPPELTEAIVAAFEPPAPLPGSLDPVTANDLLGRWVTGHPSGEPFADFSSDGRWEGSDGCNGGMGSWAVDGDGGFLATTGPSTLIACDGDPVPSWLDVAKSAGFDNGELVLFDATGSELGRLSRD